MVYENVKKGFGLALKGWRGKMGLSQEELAWRAGLHRSYVADIERGARNPSLQTIEKLAKALKVSLGRLLQPMGEPAINGTAPGWAAAGASVEIILAAHEPKDIEHILKAFKAAGLNNRVQVLENGASALDYIFCLGKYARSRRNN